MKTPSLGLGLLALIPLLGSCNSYFFCTAELEIRLEPTSVTLEVGETVTPTLELYTCGGSQRVPDTFVWTADEPQIASVDETNGTITSRSPGQTTVAVAGQTYGNLGTVEVTVLDEP